MPFYGAPGICPHTAFHIINKATVYVFPRFLHPPPYPFVSVLPSDTNGNIFYKRPKIKLFQWYILSLSLSFSSKKQLLAAKHVKSNTLAVGYRRSLALLVLQAATADCGEARAASPKCLPSRPAAIRLSMSELVFNLFPFLAMIISTSRDILTSNTLKFNRQMHRSQKSLVYLSVLFKYDNPIIIFPKWQLLRIPLSPMSTLKALIIISVAIILFQYSQCKHIYCPVNHFNNSGFFVWGKWSYYYYQENNTSLICWMQLVILCEVQLQLVKPARGRSVILPR